MVLPEDTQAWTHDYWALKADSIESELESQLVLLSTLAEIYRVLLLEVWSAWLLALPERLNPTWVFTDVFEQFSPETRQRIEAEFIEEHYLISQSRLRLIGPVLIGFNLLFGALDWWCLPKTYPLAWGIRIGVCGAAALVTGLAFKSAWFKRWNQWLVGGLLALAGLGTVLIMVLAQSTELGHTTYYAGLLLVSMCVCLLAGLRYPAVLLVSGVLIVSYVAAFGLKLWLQDDVGQSWLEFFNNSFFLVFCSFIGLVASNALERTLRVSFMIRYVLAHRFSDFLRVFGCLDSPRRLLQTVSRMRYQPVQLNRYLVTTYTGDRPLFLPVTQNVPLVEASEVLALQASSDTAEFPPNPSDQPASASGEENSNPFRNPFDQVIVILQRLWQRLIQGFAQPVEAKLDPELMAVFKLSYAEDYFYGSVRNMRVAVLSGIPMFLSFMVTDWVCLPETREVALLLRFLFVPLSAWIAYMSFRPAFFEKYHQPIMVSVTLFAGIGINVMIAVSKPEELGYQTYYAGLISDLFYVFSIAKLRLYNALWVGGSIVLGYVVIALTVQGIPTYSDGSVLLVNNTMALLGAFAIGTIACAQVNQTTRLDFFLMMVLAQNTKRLLEWQELDSPTPQVFWQMVRDLRYSPRKLEEFLIASLRQ